MDLRVPRVPELEEDDQGGSKDSEGKSSRESELPGDPGCAPGV